MQILGYDCLSDYDRTSFGDTDVAAATSSIAGATSYNAVANVDPASGHDGDVKFCVRTDLKDAYSGETMLYRSEQIKVTFSYDGSFTVAGFSTTPFVGIGADATVAAKNFGVTATVCDSAGDKTSSPPALSLGTNLFVCIEASVVGTKIPSITSFIAKKDTESDYDVSTPSSNVVIRGLGSSRVKVVMNLPARFFADTTNILLSGSVAVARDNRRRLENSALVGDSENAMFGLEIKVQDNNADSSTSDRVMMMSTVIFGVALFFM